MESNPNHAPEIIAITDKTAKNEFLLLRLLHSALVHSFVFSKDFREWIVAIQLWVLLLNNLIHFSFKTFAVAIKDD